MRLIYCWFWNELVAWLQPLFFASCVFYPCFSEIKWILTPPFIHRRRRLAEWLSIKSALAAMIRYCCGEQKLRIPISRLGEDAGNRVTRRNRRRRVESSRAAQTPASAAHIKDTDTMAPELALCLARAFIMSTLSCTIIYNNFLVN